MKETVKHQLRPHFLFNELAAIRYLIKKNPELAYDMVYDFSKYLKGNIETLVEENQIPIAQEMEHVRAYLNMEKVRFKDKLNVVYDVSHDFLIPQRVVELVVENAVKHGIAPKPQGGTVKITSEKTRQGYEILVEDDGVGFDLKLLEQKETESYAFIRRRLAMIPGAGMQVESVPEQGTVVKIWVGWGEKDENYCS